MKTAMPVVNHNGSEATGNDVVDLFLEMLDISKEAFMSADTFRPRGWDGTEANYALWSQYAAFAKETLGQRFGTTDRNKLKGFVFKFVREHPKQVDPAIQSVTKRFMTADQEVKSSQVTMAWVSTICRSLNGSK